MSGIDAFSPGVNSLNYYIKPFSGKMEVPVLASQSLYANFTYVEGVPSESGGLSLDRLKVIDSLIAQINSHQAVGAPALKASDLDLKNADDTIGRLAQQAFQMQKTAQESPVSYRAWGSTSGLVLDLRA